MAKKAVRFTAYSKAKFTFLRGHGFRVDEEAVRRTVSDPESVSRSRLGRWIAQRILSERHVLRVVYEETARERTVITFYPARRRRYEPAHEV